MTWSLKDDLCRLAHTNDLNIALCELGIIETADSTFSLQEDSDWERGGAETFIYRFGVRSSDVHERQYILKACTTYSPVSTLEEILDRWIHRRRLLTDLGVCTPKLFAFGEGMILEEWIPYSLCDVLLEPDASKNSLSEPLIQLAHYAAALYCLGFLSIAPFDDVRSRGTDSVVIDFGEDLGPAKGEPVSTMREVFESMLRILSKWNVNITDDLQTSLYGVFEAFAESAHIKDYH